MIVQWIFMCIALVQPFESRVQVHIPTAEEEAEYVWRTIRDISFFEEHNYQVSLPKGEFIESLKQKSSQNQLSDADYESLKVFMKTSVYRPEDYEKGYQTIVEKKPLIERMVREISRLKKHWAFRSFDQYQVHLTLYGPGGSYDPEYGTILIYTTPEGGFKQYDNPANTIIHEIVHIGTEEAIMNTHQVPHTLKERIIDKMVLIYFEKYLPDYRLQEFGDARIDPFLLTKRDIKRLPEVLVEFQKKYQP